ncbi:MAG TPA: quinone-dependent dihydroorotate dehydrogenase [Dongiaceae bacterium]|nr:quinone-dependent dihydroorotate dehydrogenase [Dongiaceae bacterium]
MPAGFYALLRPLLFRLTPEAAHSLAIKALRFWQGCPGPAGGAPDPALRQRIWGLDFANPVGLAAGFDKNGEVWRGILRLGFGFAEIGSVTPVAQAGNPQPRLFRLTEVAAVLNRMGFNNDGVAAMAARLQADGRDRPDRTGLLGINLGKNKTTEDAAADYEIGIRALARFADYLVINVSSPNTPGLRVLQGREPLERLVARARQALDGLAAGEFAPSESAPTRKPPLLLKIAPDLTAEDLADIAAVALAGGLDGLIVSNTTITRPGLAPHWLQEAGGLSGSPLFPLSTGVLREVYRLTQGKLPLIGVGGIASAAEAYAKIRAGASLVQLYSALIYQGPFLARRINRELAALLRRDGFGNVGEAVGADHG